MKKFTYLDSVAGAQNEKFNKLSDLARYLEDFQHIGEESSEGIIYENDRPILMYKSSLDGFFWKNYEE
jgi:hypothetical protein